MFRFAREIGYRDKDFTCCDCSEKQVWTASQQKCRSIERQRRDNPKTTHLAGLAARKAGREE